MRVCQVHGGVTPRGPSSPHWIDGRHSRILPKRLLETYRASLTDPDRLALEDDLALIDARINDVLRRVDSGESGKVWTHAREAYRALEAALRTGNDEEVRTRTLALGGLLRQGQGDWMAWSEVMGLIERRRKVVEAERKRLIAAQQMISTEQALAMMGLLVDVVRRHVRDETALRAITQEYARLTCAPGSADAPPS
jgi:hypothetical protein